MRLKYFAKSVLKFLHHHHKTKPDIYIFTLPRAGSTLLAEVLNTDPNTKTASESLTLNNDNIQVLKKYFDSDFLAERYVDITEKDLQQMFAYHADLSKGITWNSYYWSDLFTSSHRLRTNRTVFKTHKITYYFDEFMKKFSDDFGLYLLRHPVSHSLSRMSDNWDPYLDLYSKSKKIRNTLKKETIRKIDEIGSGNSKLNKMIISWCLENHEFIMMYQNKTLPHNVFPVFYEDLVEYPEKTVKKICEEVRMQYSDRMIKAIDLPSSGIIHSSVETEEQIKSGNKTYLLSRWKEKITEEERKDIREILDIFDIRIYQDI